MSFLRDQYIDEIVYLLSIIRYEMSSHNKIGRFNTNKRAEDFFCELLNLIYDWHLSNANNGVNNSPGIDLIDYTNRIAVQVSSTADHQKIQNSIDKFIHYYPTMNGSHFYMMIITAKQDDYKKDFDTHNKIVFQKNQDILDIDCLITVINTLSVHKMKAILTYLREELGVISKPLASEKSTQVEWEGINMENNQPENHNFMEQKCLKKSSFPLPSIFISYNWNQSKFVDEIEKSLNEMAVIIRDKNDIKSWDIISNFMKTIRKQDFAVLIVSKEYLESDACMFEVLQLMKEEAWKDKIMTIVWDNAKIYSPLGRAEYLAYWNNKFKDLENEIRSLPQFAVSELSATLNKYQNILGNIGTFTEYVADINNPSPKYAIDEIKKRIANHKNASL